MVENVSGQCGDNVNNDEDGMCREDGQKGLPARPQRVKARGVPSGVR